MPATTASPRETAERFLRAAVGADPGDMADCYAPSVVIELPFAVAPLIPARVETTREELRTRFRAGAASRRYQSVSEVVIHETADSDVVIIEYELHGEFTETAEPFALRFLMVLTVKEGQIVHSRDYSDPIAGAQVIGRLPELIAALSAAGTAISG
jgi:uncharacterized protein